MRQCMLSVVALWLTACQPLALQDEISPHYLPPLGSRLILNRGITIPPNQLSVYLQYGKILPSRDVDAYQPNCKFELRDIFEYAQHITPDQFEIYKIQRDSQLVLSQPITIATLGRMSEGDAPMAEIYSTTFYLRSPKQPQVLYLTCQHWDDPSTGSHLNIKQIRKTLGDIMSLEIRQRN